MTVFTNDVSVCGDHWAVAYIERGKWIYLTVIVANLDWTEKSYLRYVATDRKVYVVRLLILPGFMSRPVVVQPPKL